VLSAWDADRDDLDTIGRITQDTWDRCYSAWVVSRFDLGCLPDLLQHDTIKLTPRGLHAMAPYLSTDHFALAVNLLIASNMTSLNDN
jgi:hypothetical protein